MNASIAWDWKVTTAFDLLRYRFDELHRYRVCRICEYPNRAPPSHGAPPSIGGHYSQWVIRTITTSAPTTPGECVPGPLATQDRRSTETRRVATLLELAGYPSGPTAEASVPAIGLTGREPSGGRFAFPNRTVVTHGADQDGENGDGDGEYGQWDEDIKQGNRSSRLIRGASGPC